MKTHRSTERKQTPGLYMLRKLKCLVRAGTAAVVLCAVSTMGQTTSFTYQGYLEEAGQPANGLFDFKFSLIELPEVFGNPTVVGELTNSSVTVSDGSFQTLLDFGAAEFDGSQLQLEIAVRTNGGGAFEILSPRQLITSAPYAIRAAHSAAVESGSVTDPTFIGTTTLAPLELSVNSTPVFRIQYSASPGGMQPNIVAGNANWVDAGVRSSVIAGGGGPGASNSITGDANTSFNVIGGGVDNHIANSSSTTIAGGEENSAGSGADYSTIAGGFQNRIEEQAAFAFIAGGRDNMVTSNASYAFAAGRRARATHQGSFVWADSTDANFNSTSSNQFLIRASGGVGIGKKPTSELDVAGTIKAYALDSGGNINAKKYDLNVPGSFSYNIPGNTMVVRDDGETYSRSASGYISQGAGTTTISVFAELNLPQGAIIIGAELHYFDNSLTGDFSGFSGRIRRRAVDSASNENIVVFDEPSPPGAALATLRVLDPSQVVPSRAEVDNNAYQYWVYADISCTNPGDSNLRIYGFRVIYELQTLLP